MASRWEMARDVAVTVSAVVVVLATLAGGVTWIATKAVGEAMQEAVNAAVPLAVAAAVDKAVPLAVAAAVQPLNDAIGQLSAKVDGIESTVGQLSGRVAKVEDAVGQLSTRVGKVESKVNDIDNTVGQLSGKVDEIENLVLAGRLETVDELAQAYPDATWTDDYGTWLADQDFWQLGQSRRTSQSAP